MAIDEIRKEELKDYLVPYVRAITLPDPKAGRGKYKCPLCGSGTGKKGTGAFTVYPETKSWHCFSCGETGDIFALVEKIEGITNFPEQVEFVEKFAGLPSIQDYPIKKYNDKEYTENTSISDEDRQRYARERKEYIERCASRAGGTDYFAKRGFTETEVRRFNLGYDPHYAQDGRPGIVIPYNDEDYYYVLRHTDKGEDKYRAPRKAEGNVGRRIYNRAALYGNEPCFVCEGELNAISILAVASDVCGAVAFGGTGNSNLLIEAVKERKPTYPLILNLDPDEAGENAKEKITGPLDELKIPYIFANFDIEKYPEGKRNDANDFLVADRIQLKKDIYANVEAAANMASPALEEAAEEYKEYADFIEEHNGKNASELLKNFINGISESANTEAIPTGFDKLDDELDGGLYPGLYTVGAVSSLGKTTLVLQIAEQIAAAGHEVLLISMEMPANELISKSISRLTYMHCHESTKNAKTARGITAGSRYSRYSKEERALIDIAINHYKRYAGNIYIYEGIGDIGVTEIREIAQKHKETSVSGKAPVIIVDYLQILAPYDVRATDKQNTDKAVLELKRISRDLHVPVIMVSSFNRDNYKNEVNEAAFKESGAIEYGSDVLLALQPQGLKKNKPQYNSEVLDKCKESDVRHVELVVLKNRNGKARGRVGFTYYSLFNYFEVDYNYRPHKEDLSE